MGKPELADMMRRYCAGESNAFNELYSALSPALFGYLMKMSGNRSLAEDLLQQTFMKVHRSRASYVEGADPSPWIYAIAHRTFIDAVRKQKRAKVKLTFDGELRPQAAHITGQDIDNVEVGPDPEVVEQAMTALSELPELQRQAVVLVKLQGKSIQDAAEIAGTTPGAMKVRAHRGYSALRRVFEKVKSSG